MKKTNKEQKKSEEVEVQTPASSRFCNFINNIDYKKHWKYIIGILLLSILLFFYICSVTFYTVIQSGL